MVGLAHPLDTAWHNFLWSFDLTDTGKRHFYLDDADASPTWTTYVNTALNFNGGPVAVGADADGFTSRLAGDLFDLALWFNQYVDLSVEANRRKFIDANGKPVDLGSDGSAALGVAADMFFSGPASEWNDTVNNNKGTGGAFASISGAVTDASTSPTD